MGFEWIPDLAMSGVAIPNPYWHYGMHVAVGDFEIALDYLEAMVEEEFPRYPLSRLMANGKDPLFDPYFCENARTRLRPPKAMPM